MGSLIYLQSSVWAQSQNNADEPPARGSIPEEILRPNRGESPRFAIDTVIGPLGRGDAPQDAYRFARQIATGLLEKETDNSGIKTINSVSLENLLNTLEQIEPNIFRIGGGKEENDGSVSFLIRFIGRDKTITGELFIRKEIVPEKVTPPISEPAKTTTEEKASAEDTEPNDSAGTAIEPVSPAAVLAELAEAEDSENRDESELAETEQQENVQLTAAPRPPITRWVFEDLLLEDVQDRGLENEKADQHFDFSPYQRFF